MSLLDQWSKPVELPLEVLHHGPCHPHPPLIVEVELVMDWLRLPPLVHLMLLVLDHTPCSLIPHSATPDTEPVEPGGVSAPIVSVLVGDPGIDFLDVSKVVHVVIWCWSISLKPDELRGVEEGSYGELVAGVSVEQVLLVDYLLEADKPPHYSVSVRPPYYVIKTC